MAWIDRAVTFATATATSVAASPPGDAVDGDILLALVCHSSSTAGMTTVPTGWTALGGDAFVDNSVAGDMGIRAYTHEYDSADTTYSWIWSLSGTVTTLIGGWAGHDLATPVATWANAAEAAVDNILPVSIAAPGTDGCLLVLLAAVDASGTRTWTQTGSMTERADNNTTVLAQCLAQELQTTSAAVTREATVTGTVQQMGGFLIALKPAVVAGGLPPTSRRLRPRSTHYAGARFGR